MKAALLKYWRYDRQYPLVALEVDSALEDWLETRADILAVSEGRHLTEIEVKLTIGDLRRDKQKQKHKEFQAHDNHRYPTSSFYFAVPYELANQVCLICGQLYPYAGVLGVKRWVGHDGDTYFEVTSYRNPKQLGNKKVSWRELRNMARAQSATLCRLSDSLARLKREQNHA